MRKPAPRDRSLVEIVQALELRKPRQAEAAKQVLLWLLEEPEPERPHFAKAKILANTK